jgi:hypothetical protein
MKSWWRRERRCNADGAAMLCERDGGGIVIDAAHDGAATLCALVEALVPCVAGACVVHEPHLQCGGQTAKQVSALCVKLAFQSSLLACHRRKFVVGVQLTRRHLQILLPMNVIVWSLLLPWCVVQRHCCVRRSRLWMLWRRCLMQRHRKREFRRWLLRRKWI